MKLMGARDRALDIDELCSSWTSSFLPTRPVYNKGRMLSILRKARLKDKEMRILML
jgi:hypothetical protein